MGLCTCDKCGKEYSYASGECPKCGYPAPGYRVACRVCQKVISYKRHSEYYTSSAVVNGSTSTSQHRYHCRCPHCGEPKPLLLVNDRAVGFFSFLALSAWFVPPAVLLIDFRASLGRWPWLSGLDPEAAVWTVIGAYVVGSMLAAGRGVARSAGRLVWGASILGTLVSIRQEGTALAIAAAALAFAIYRQDQARARAGFEREHIEPLKSKKEAA